MLVRINILIRGDQDNLHNIIIIKVEGRLVARKLILNF